jgi:flagellar operon protein
VTPIDPGIAPAGPVTGAAGVHGARRAGTAAAPGFDGLLRSRLQAADGAGALRWSSHAVQRLSQRQIQITPEMQTRLEGAVDRLAGKGGRDSVVLMDGNAFLVSVTNRTVITAVDRTAMRDQVFTNIDSAVLG